MPNQKYSTPGRSVLPVTKVSDAVFGTGAMGGPEGVRLLMEEAGTDGVSIVVSKKHGTAVHNVYIGEDVLSGVSLPEGIDAYDLAVFSACCSVMEAGNRTFTPRQILSAMTGGRSNKNNKGSSAALRSVEQSIDRMMRKMLCMDWTEQAKEWGIDTSEIATCVVMEALLPAKKGMLTLQNGHRECGYEMLDEPQLYTYAKAVRQVITVKNEFLAVPGINMTAKSIKIRNYLIQRIWRMSGTDGKKNTFIRFETLFKKCCIEAGSRNAAKDVRDTTYMILDHFKNTGVIGGYEKIMAPNGCSVESVRIAPADENEASSKNA